MGHKFINRVELQGQVGTVRFSPGGNSLVANFSVMVEHELTSREGRAVIECTWLNVTAVEGQDIRMDRLTRGSFVHLTGRLRNSKYTDACGMERTFTEIIASSLEVMDA